MNSIELKERTKQFAHRCVKLAATLPATKLGNHIAGQLIRCSTSVPANYRAACLAQSKAAFAAKVSIVLEETDESAFWIEFAVDEKLVSLVKTADLMKEATDLTKIFGASRKTASKQREL
ncbi:MAG: four helix bundle protein [Chitinophagales bacterium]|nr:four helix bundle protein [Chitinophagales bacterium]